jgi:hypothetical protein
MNDADGRGGRPSGPGGSFWPALAIAAIIAATAGWTVVAVMVVNGPSPSAAVVPTDDPNATDVIPSDGEDSPLPERHEFSDLEAILPSTIGSVTVKTESWSGSLGDAFFEGDGLLGVITAAGKLETDAQLAIGYDAAGVATIQPSVLRVAGVSTQSLLEASVKAWSDSSETFSTTTFKVGDRTVVKGTEAGEPLGIYWYRTDDLLFSVWSDDEQTARDIILNLSNKPYPVHPVVAPSAPVTPSPSASPSGSASPSASAS